MYKITIKNIGSDVLTEIYITTEKNLGSMCGILENYNQIEKYKVQWFDGTLNQTQFGWAGFNKWNSNIFEK